MKDSFRKEKISIFNMSFGKLNLLNFASNNIYFVVWQIKLAKFRV